MATIYRDADADVGVLDGRTVAVVGYGNQGRAQALNLRDSGVTVVVGNGEDDYAARARDDGLDVLAIADAARAGDVILLLLPDEVQPPVFDEQIAPGLEAGNALCFASGYNVHYRRIVAPDGVDVILVAPRMIGQAVRSLYQHQAGFPCLVAAERDATGRAMATALALAKGIGATRLGAFASSFEEETLIDLYAEQMLWPAIVKLCLLYFEKLTAAGCDPEVVTTELYLSGEFVEIARAMIREGFFGQLQLHSHTSQYGQLSRADRMAPPAVREAADAALEEIRSGAFAREWAAEQDAGLPALKRLHAEALAHPMHASEQKLETLRRLMAQWI